MLCLSLLVVCESLARSCMLRASPTRNSLLSLMWLCSHRHSKIFDHELVGPTNTQSRWTSQMFRVACYAYMLLAARHDKPEEVYRGSLICTPPDRDSVAIAPCVSCYYNNPLFSLSRPRSWKPYPAARLSHLPTPLTLLQSKSFRTRIKLPPPFLKSPRSRRLMLSRVSLTLQSQSHQHRPRPTTSSRLLRVLHPRRLGLVLLSCL
ncbi:hypothetical protein R3P38DRAFT_1191510 [Favolaschia claudopus]|uniref:Secreted protein n=1 Tax=Favolaschia claudopus TaxID=2862362 RepID=A0AAW0E2I7_9AGAR